MHFFVLEVNTIRSMKGKQLKISIGIEWDCDIMCQHCEQATVKKFYGISIATITRVRPCRKVI